MLGAADLHGICFGKFSKTPYLDISRTKRGGTNQTSLSQKQPILRNRFLASGFRGHAVCRYCPF